ncbi:hypothetical protein ACE01N_20195, partial [Saccharicrinis sp. FJH2]|uniref:hypothetical protein n=1 Tax=Saccharicrinis sp. FJH65 TaxID=3344659 RepID=UPI0035F3CD95
MNNYLQHAVIVHGSTFKQNVSTFVVSAFRPDSSYLSYRTETATTPYRGNVVGNAKMRKIIIYIFILLYSCSTVDHEKEI